MRPDKIIIVLYILGKVRYCNFVHLHSGDSQIVRKICQISGTSVPYKYVHILCKHDKLTDPLILCFVRQNIGEPREKVF